MQHVADVAGLPLGVADRVPGVGAPRARRARRRARRRPRRTRAARRPARRAPARPSAAARPWRGRPRRRRRRRRAARRSRSTSSVAGLISVDVRSRAHSSPLHVRSRTRPRRPRPRTAAGRRGVSSGCHCTPTHECVARAARPPGRRRRRSVRADDQAVAEPVDRLVVVALHVESTRRSAPASRVPGRPCDRRCREHARCPAGSGRGRRRRAGAGAGCRRSATLSTWAPRQMPSTGMPRSIAPRSSANSQASRIAVRGSSVVGCGCCAVAAGSTSRPPVRIRPSRPSSTAVGDVGVDRLRRQQHRDAAGQRHRRRSRWRAGSRPHVPHAGLRLLQVGGQADRRAGAACSVRAAQSHAPAPSR